MTTWADFAITEKTTFWIENQTSFSIYNPSDKTIDPRDTSLIITFRGSSTNLTISNNTTGDSWQYTGTTIKSDFITLDGVRALKNDASIFANTNRQLITLVPGWNDFTITGVSGYFEVTFDFRFYYV